MGWCTKVIGKAKSIDSENNYNGAVFKILLTNMHEWSVAVEAVV
jgi:hypothetical protein